MSKIYKTAIYLRLSREDEGKGESCSIANQRQLLTEFISDREDLELVAEFNDDGYSGYGFDRPQFDRMMKAAESGEIECIVVKDLSRLGRNFQKTEEYIQRVFPKYGIRFIAVTNCFDSLREQTSSERLANPIINLMNEFHVMETSQKVRAVFEHLRRSGKFIGNHAVFGSIIKDRKLVVDDEAAEIVRKIFDMKMDGYSNQGIADYLNSCGIASPLEHKIEKGIKATGTHLREGNKALWQSMSVRRILENPVYIGTLIQGKTTTASYRDKRRYKKPESELAVFEEAHEAIISDTTFLIVQDLMQRDSYVNSKKGCYLFTSFAYCGSCGKLLYHRQEGENYVSWQCKNKECNCKGRMSESSLSEAVFETLKKHIEIVVNHSEPVEMPDIISDSSAADMETTELENQIKQLKDSKIRLTEQKENGAVSDSDYDEMVQFYNYKITKAEREKEDIQNRKLRILRSIGEIKKRYKRYTEMTELTRATVVAFIDKIEVFGTSKIRIHFRYEDFFKSDGGDVNGS